MKQKQVLRPTMKLKIIIRKISKDVFIGHCPSLPGCAIEAESEDAARNLLKAAINAYIVSCKQRNEKLPV